VTGVHRAEGREASEDRLGELVAGNLDDDALEVLGGNVSVAILVEEVVRLAETLALEALDELSELRVAKNVLCATLAEVELDPVAVKVEGWCVRKDIADIGNSRIPLWARFSCITDLNSWKSTSPEASLHVSKLLALVGRVYLHVKHRKRELVVGIGLDC